MINYAKHDEEFYGIFKLVSGEEVLGKAVLTDDNEETLVFLQDPVAVSMIVKESSDESKVVRGMGLSQWQQLSDEDFFILREKDIITVASMKKEIIILYEAFLLGEQDTEKMKREREVELDPSVGYLGRIDKARKSLEKIFKNPPDSK
jgi:hypothetical protein